MCFVLVEMDRTSLTRSTRYSSGTEVRERGIGGFVVIAGLGVWEK